MLTKLNTNNGNPYLVFTFLLVNLQKAGMSVEEYCCLKDHP